MISEQLAGMFNRQAAAEANAASQYLAMALWCDGQGLQGAAAFLYHSHEEELAHMRAFLRYVVDQNGLARAPGVPEPPAEYNSLPEIFEAVLELEMSVATAIHAIVDHAHTEHDHAAYNWLQTFVTEQRDAEVLSRQILDTIKIIGLDGNGLYLIDQYLVKLPAADGA